MNHHALVQQMAMMHNYRFHPHALKRLCDFVGEPAVDDEQRRGMIKELFSLLQQHNSPDRFVNLERIEIVIAQQSQKWNSAEGREGSSQYPVAVPLPDVPRFLVDEVTEDFKEAPKNVALDRLQALKQRYLHARRRCLRSGLYRKGISKTAHTEALSPLLPISALDGIRADAQISVLGLIEKKGDSYLLEDPRGQVKVSFSNESSTDSIASCFMGTGFLVVVTGFWGGGALSATRIDLPPAERRDNTLRSLGRSVDLFGAAPADTAAALAAEQKALQSVIVLLAHVHLDKAYTRSRLTDFFVRMQERGEQELAETTFVFVGNFSSSPISYGDVSHLTNAMDESDPVQTLLDVLGSCVVANAPTAAQHSQFIFVPGPEDPSSLLGMHPQPPLATRYASGLKSRLKRVVLAPNPCRIRFFTHEVIISRRDYFRAFQLAEHDLGLVPPIRITSSADSAPESTSFERIAKSVLDEGHLFPDSGVSVLWKMDDSLRLPVLPHTLLLCDSTEQWECMYKGVHVVNPGSFSASSTFLWYTPSDGECSLSTV